MSVLLFSNVNFALSSFSNIVHHYKDCSLLTCKWRNSRKSLRIESDSYFHRYNVFDNDSNRYFLKSLNFASTANKNRFVVDITYKWTFRQSFVFVIKNKNHDLIFEILYKKKSYFRRNILSIIFAKSSFIRNVTQKELNFKRSFYIINATK